MCPSYAQSGNSYEIGLRPDIWYNDVDGIMIGTRFEGRVAGTDEEGPHRLDAGIWLGTWFPAVPVSYQMQYTEPFSSLSEYGNEFHIRLSSSIRQGYHTHGISLKKRWERNYDFLNYTEAGVAYHFEKRFDDEYTLFPQLWGSEWKGLVKPEINVQRVGTRNRSNLSLNPEFNTLDPFFYSLSASLSHELYLGEDWAIRLRLFSATVSEDTPPEYLLFLSSGAEVTTLDGSLTRAKGTVPVRWAKSGNIHFASGPNLRGYTKMDIRSIRNEAPLQFTEVASINTEFSFPNPIQTGLRNIEELSDFLSFRSYLFFDGAAVGTSALSSESVNNDYYANAGIGLAFALNIPDYLGKPRGFVIRYEVPFWLSDAFDGSNFKYRHLIGIGATVMF